MRFFTRAAAVALVLLSGQALAMDGSNGCGPGWYVFKDNSIVSSLLRGTTHYTLFPVVTFGMTFGTSNCAKHTLVMQDEDSVQFVSSNFEVLRHDIARGEGEHLNAYFASFSCQPIVNGELATALQKAYRDGLNQSESPVDYVNATRTLIEASPASQKMCS